MGLGALLRVYVGILDGRIMRFLRQLSTFLDDSFKIFSGLVSLKSGFLSYIGRDLLGLLFWVHWWGRFVEGIWACGYLAVKTDGFATVALIKRLGRLRNMSV